MTNDEMRAGLIKAYELLAYGVPDPDLTNSVSGPAWIKECDEWLDKFPPSKLPAPSPEPTGQQIGDGWTDEQREEMRRALNRTAGP